MDSLGKLVIVCACGLLIGCGQYAGDEGERGDAPIPVAEPESVDAEQTAPAETPESQGPITREFDGIQFTIPAGWQEVELRPMQQGIIDARYRFDGASQELQLTLSSAGGGIEANIARWKAQIQSAPGEQPVVDKLSIDGVEATWVDARGTYQAAVGSVRGPHPNWRLVGVAIPKEPADYYVKLIGPRDAVAKVYDEFRSFVKSARIKG